MNRPDTEFDANPIGRTGTNMPSAYGRWNLAGAVTAARRFWDVTFAIRTSAAHRNAGMTLNTPQVRQGGVLAGDTGLLSTYGYLGQGGTKHRAPFRGVLFWGTSVKEPSQTVLSQWAQTPEGYSGDLPSDLQAQVQNAPPWRRAAARGDSRQAFRSGVMRGIRL